MAETGSVYSIDALIGMTILSSVTGNKLGQVEDLLLDPGKGEMLGLVARTSDGRLLALAYTDVHSFGPDAVMAAADDSLVALEGAQLAAVPGAKKDVTGAKIITEGGKLLGQVANIFIHVSPPPLAIYEVRESILDKLLGRAMFIPASVGRGLSDDSERIIVPNDVAENAADNLETLVARLLSPSTNPRITVRSRGMDEETLVRNRSGES